MPETRGAVLRPTGTDWALLCVLASIWGTAFLFTKVAVAAIPPLTVAAGRLTLAALVLGSLARRAGHRLPDDAARWRGIVAMAVFGNALPFFLISWGQVVVDSGVAGVLMAAMPLTTVVLAHYFVEGEPLHRTKSAGFLLGFAGIVVLVGPQALGRFGGSNATLLRQGAVLAGAMCYALNTILARRLPPTPPIVIAAATLALASAVTLPVALAVDAPWRLVPDVGAVAAVIHLGIVATALAMTVYYRVVASAGPSFLAMTNYLIPVVAVATGIVVAGEPSSWNLWAALALVLSGVALGRVRA